MLFLGDMLRASRALDADAETVGVIAELLGFGPTRDAQDVRPAAELDRSQPAPYLSTVIAPVLRVGRGSAL